VAALDVAIGNHDTNKLHGLPPFRGLAVQGSGFQGSIKDSSNLIERDDVLLEKDVQECGSDNGSRRAEPEPSQLELSYYFLRCRRGSFWQSLLNAAAIRQDL
jgi:hypothetical protein